MEASKHVFQYPLVVEIMVPREPLSPDSFGDFPPEEIKPKELLPDVLSKLGRRVLNEVRNGNGHRNA